MAKTKAQTGSQSKASIKSKTNTKAKADFPPLEIPYQDIFLAGVDEVGRGPLVGSVVTAAVILDPEQPIEGLADSKKLSEKRREALFDEIQQKLLQ